ncbi:MAG: ATP-binding protein [Cyanobacteria bacterium]|nr:ATP-binding protein [Cyanobacteriota bacterium]
MILSRSVRRPWRKLSFASTLHLCPVLDLLTADVPPPWRDQVRLGLQEALVNAAKHGNCLDPSKQVYVRFMTMCEGYWWVITDQGCGFETPHCCSAIAASEDAGAIAEVLDDPFALPCDDWECGRGLFILRQVFDGVQWSDCGRELRLYKALAADEAIDGEGAAVEAGPVRLPWDSWAARLRERCEALAR